MLAGMLIAVAVFALFVALHSLVFRLAAPARGRFPILLVCFAATLAGAVAADRHVSNLKCIPAPWVHGGFPLAAAATVLTGLALLALYLPFYFTANTSLSVRAFIAIERSPGRRLPESLVRDAIGSEAVVRGRLETLTASGYLRRDGDVYRLTARGRTVAAIFRAVAGLWNLREGG